jgi:hypothetical protein
MIEIPAQGAAESLDARRLAMGEIGQGAVFDFAVIAVGLAKENGGRGVAVGDGGDVYADLIQQSLNIVKVIINNVYIYQSCKKEGSTPTPITTYLKFRGGRYDRWKSG